MRYIKFIYSMTRLLPVFGLTLGLTAGNGWAVSIPLMIPYSGSIAVKGAPAPFDGSGQFKFAIVNGHADCQSSPPGGGCIAYWSNDLTSANGNEPTNFVALPVSGGNFGVKLGDPDLTNMVGIPGTVFDNGETYLRVWFRDPGIGSGFELLTPDRQLVSVPYAYRADVANAVTGLATVGTSQIADGAVTGDKIADGAIVVNAGTGLTGGGESGDVTLNVNLAGTGSATSVARSDHNHDAAYVNAAGDTIAQLEITGNLTLPSTTETTGIIISGTNRFIHNYGIDNFFAGINAGNLTMTGWYNTASGNRSLNSNTTGTANTAIGTYSLLYNTEGLNNTASGFSSLYANTTGANNTANGYFSLAANTTGSDNTATGAESLNSNTTGGFNSATGVYSLRSNTMGSYNTSNGYASLNSNTTGSSNSAFGYLSLYYNTTGIKNTAIGEGSLFLNTLGSENSGLGNGSLNANTEGYANTAVGSLSLGSNTTGVYNTASGYKSLFYNTTGNNNTANGVLSLNYNTTGAFNTASGMYSLYYNTIGLYGTASGYGSLVSNTAGNHNTASGYYSLFLNTTGNGNTALGSSAGYFNTTGSNNTFIGYNSDTTAGGLSNATAIGYGAFVNASNKVRIGNSSVSVIEGQVAWSNLSDIRTKKDISDLTLGLDFITSLRPVEFRMKDGNDKINLGFIAQDIEALLGVDYSVLGIGEDEERMLSLRYTDFIAPLVKAIQEQQVQIQKLREEDQEIADLKAQLFEQQARIESLQEQLESVMAALKARP